MPDGQTAKSLPIWRARIDVTCSGYKARGRGGKVSLSFPLDFLSPHSFNKKQ